MPAVELRLQILKRVYAVGFRSLHKAVHHGVGTYSGHLAIVFDHQPRQTGSLHVGDALRHFDIGDGLFFKCDRRIEDEVVVDLTTALASSATASRICMSARLNNATEPDDLLQAFITQ